MRAPLLVMVAATACGSTAKDPPTTPIAAPAGTGEVGETTGVGELTTTGDPAEPPGPYPEAGPSCMPAGRYTATWDLSVASITRGGQSAMADCRQLAELVPQQNMRTMSVDFTNGNLVVHWPGLQQVSITSECAFEVTSQPVHVALVFAGGAGAGTASYSIGSPNHPEEDCDITNAKVELVRERW